MTDHDTPDHVADRIAAHTGIRVGSRIARRLVEKSGVVQRDMADRVNGTDDTDSRRRGMRARAAVAELCAAAGLHLFWQPDPRGAPLYVSAVPIDKRSHARLGTSVPSSF